MIEENKDIVLSTAIKHDNYTAHVLKMYDVPPNEKSIVTIKNNIKPPDNWQIGLIYGPSGSGKSTLLKTFGKIKQFNWNKDSVISNFSNISPEDACMLLSAVGFSSPPSWLRCYDVLSNGEKFRADLAMALNSDDEIILIDEFTSVIDRNVAKAASFALQKLLRKTSKKIVLASCHADIIEWLSPDWIYNPTEGITHSERSLWRKPKISLKIFRAEYAAWDLFKHHHYLTADLNRSAKVFMITWEDNPIAITAILSFPHPRLSKAWRASRTVVLPDYQGLGIGSMISDYMGSLVRGGGGRFYSRTTHPSMIAHRLKLKDKWRVGKIGQVSPVGKTSGERTKVWKWDPRECYSFEYIGPASSAEEAKLFYDNTRLKDQSKTKVVTLL